MDTTNSCDDEDYEDDDSPMYFGVSDQDLVQARIRRNLNLAARDLLGDQRLLAFLKEGLSFGCTAFDEIYEAFASGRGLDMLTRCDAEFGYVLRAEERGKNIFCIEFGHRPEDGLISGGEWLVRFDSSGHVENVDFISIWPDSD